MSLTAALLAGLAGVVAGIVLGRAQRRGGPPAVPPLPELHPLADLLRRAHDAVCVSFVTSEGAAATAFAPEVARDVQGRCEALGRLALHDGRRHVVAGRELALAVAEETVGIAMICRGATHEESQVQAALDELSALAASVHGQQHRARPGRSLRVSGLFRRQSLGGAATALAEAVQQVADRPVGVVVRDPAAGGARIVAVSSHGDRRLEGTTVGPESAVARALAGGQAVAADTVEQLLGHYRPDRRRREDEGIVFPLRDGDVTVGALIVFGQIRAVAAPVREQIQALAAEAGPALAHVLQVEEASARALTDELTGLANRRVFERARATCAALPPDARGSVGLVCVDLDRFKRLNDEYGHEAGDAVLRHLARLFRHTLRQQDTAIRMGGEEFVLWLPGAGLAEATDVAERVRAVVERTPCWWRGVEIPVTCSAGVAAVPEVTAEVDNLYAVADAALYRAKEGGRNRVAVGRAADAEPRAAESRYT